MSTRLSARQRSGLPRITPALTVAAVAVCVVLAGCGSVAAPGSASGQGSTTGAATSPVSTASPATSPGSIAGSGQPSASASASGPVPAACATAGLKVRLDTAAAGVAAGSYYVPLEFTNMSGHVCQLTGYPAVLLTSGSAGQQIGPAAAVDRAVPASAVRLAPGATAHAWLQLLSSASYPPGKCHPVTAAGLQVVLPGSQSASYLAHPVPTCRSVIKGSEILTVHPVQQGRARRGTA